ncbi:hypothetical protein IRP63_13900 (plasmid) [Clostridium botulinum]|uniref:hypothetical protein n=1 Tax=Clostridium botulinum TaxID=1491 RepID=UPI0006A4D574|nr:hypothetical protein [Clostridium botulinum]KOC56908.1 hypothetical protein ADU89_01565 [Clostridium botulinum]KOC57383.1 hypothetical protein ADU90_06105 [Clostridium botulinum]MCD3232619.1 hypothetical protein [Clostridium botulinum D/C]MCD3238452.1 hypothetical protein [Clostridium botulinum D/C]MCD3266028.1 hypothetical protein [Clostridium botulinum D/C]
MENMLKELKEEYVGKEVKLLELDNDMCSRFDYADSIFDGNTKEFLEDGFCWETAEMEGFNFEFDVIEQTEDILDTVVKVVSIDIV